MSHSEEMDQAIFKFVFGAAMRDATLQRAFSGKKAWMKDCDQFPKSREAIKKLVSEVIEGKYADRPSYEESFRVACETVCKEIKRFTFGNAQKLINMVMKFFYLHSYGREEEKEHFRFCHCPMDSQMLEMVWIGRENLTEETKEDLKRKGLWKREEFLKSWGNEDFPVADGEKVFVFPDRYMLFQQAVRELSEAEGKSPLEFDYCEWGK